MGGRIMKDENELPQNRSGTVPAESNNHKTIVFCRIAYVCFGIQIGLGIMALSGWACNLNCLLVFAQTTFQWPKALQ